MPARSLARVDRLDEVRDDPYLAPPVREAVDKVHTQLARADREAQHAAVAAELAPAIFGGEGPRTYLLVVQNNAESRATGGFIGSYGLITALDGKLDVGELLRTHNLERPRCVELPDVSYEAPDDYRTRYTQFAPATTLQNVNLSPDFPSVAQVLMSLAPQAGLTTVDGVLSVDPQGLAALLELTGPVDVVGWPTPITAENVVNVTLRDAYARVRGDARTRRLPRRRRPGRGRRGHVGQPRPAGADRQGARRRSRTQGHLVLAFARPEEQELAVELGVSGRMEPVRSDAVAVTTSNAGRRTRSTTTSNAASATRCSSIRTRGRPRLTSRARSTSRSRTPPPADGSPADRDRAVRPAVLRR